MANPLTHALVAMAAYAAVVAARGEPAVGVPLLLSGLLSLLLDLGEGEDHRRKSPWTHSVPMAAAALLLAFLAAATGPPWAGPAPLVVLTAVPTHLLLDLFSVGGVPLWPRHTPEGWRWRTARYRFRFGDDDPLYNLSAAAPSLAALAATLAL